MFTDDKILVSFRVPRKLIDEVKRLNINHNQAYIEYLLRAFKYDRCPTCGHIKKQIKTEKKEY